MRYVGVLLLTLTSILLRLVTLSQNRPAFVFDQCGAFSAKSVLSNGIDPTNMG